MLMQPIKDNRNRIQTARTKWIEAPTKGWNAKSDLSDMEEMEAVVLDNVVVTERGVRLRPGFSAFTTGLGGPILALMEHSAIDGTSKLFGATATAIYNVSSSGAVGAANLSGLGSGAWQHAMFSTAGGNFLVIVNGIDAPRNYDGTSWTTPAITGVTAANLISVTPHMSRLWFVEKNTLKIWYLPATSIAGAATAIDLGPLSRLGGYLVGMASWTRDGGSGPDDVAVFLTSKGEAHVYSGSDPASATTWRRVGTFKIPEPIGRRCFVKAGSDVGVLTSQGLIPLSNVLPIAASEVARVAATEKIGGAVQTAYEGAKNNRGWQCIEYPKLALALINVPLTEGVIAHQYVVSTTKGGWSRWTGLPAECWSLLGDRLFFGGNDGKTYELTGSSDNNTAIAATIVQAFSELGTSRSKTLKRIRPQFYGPAGNRPTVGVRLDYSDYEITYNGISTETAGPVWDAAPWDTSDWGPGSFANAWWQAITGSGFAVAIVIKITSSEPVTYNGSRLMYSLGNDV